MHNEKKKNVLKIIFGSMAMYMTYLVIVTSMKSNLFKLPAEVVNEPWFQTLLIDFYFLVTILSVWVIYKENSILAKVLWILSFICWGSIGAAMYVLVQLVNLKKGEGLQQVLLRKEQE